MNAEETQRKIMMPNCIPRGAVAFVCVSSIVPALSSQELRAAYQYCFAGRVSKPSSTIIRRLMYISLIPELSQTTLAKG